jgi:hypothetical protein
MKTSIWNVNKIIYFGPLKKIQDLNFLLKTHMKQVNGSFLSIHAKFQPCRL